MHILLVHGAAHTQRCWDDLKPCLEQHGLDVHTLTLPGHGDGVNGFGVSMSRYASAVCKKARSIGEPCLLAGHSMGGLVITAAAEKSPELFSRLIYITAFAPKSSGERLASMSHGNTSSESAKGLKLLFTQGKVEFNPATVEAIFYGECSGDLTRLTRRNLCPQPIRPFFSKVGWSEEYLGAIPKDYIECTLDRGIPVDFQRQMQNNMHFLNIRSLACDHSPFSSMPNELAATIEELSKG